MRMAADQGVSLKKMQTARNTAADKTVSQAIRGLFSHSGSSRKATATKPPMARASIRQGINTYAPTRLEGSAIASAIRISKAAITEAVRIVARVCRRTEATIKGKLQ